jgi:16S rRNA (cytosine967-C5)-methyltransferase
VKVDPRVLTVAERVIARTDRDHPADAVLRLETQNRRDLSSKEAAELSHLVFTYYRWRGWLEAKRSIADQLQDASVLAKRFEKQPESFSDDELVERSVPSWVRNEIETTGGLARAWQSQPQLWLRARPGKGQLLAQRLRNCRILGPGPLADALAYDGSDDLFRTKEFHAGEFELQDISSQAVGLVCAPKPGETWWDVCAGEGGKMLHLSDLMGNQGLIWASDRAEWRLARLKRRAGRAKVFNYRKVIWDGVPKLPTKTKFDGILVDAPCSGTGTWQRNPHARWTLTAKDLKELMDLQLRLLVHASAALKPGGKLVYSVCSLTQSETVQVVKAFERLALAFTPLLLKDPLTPGASDHANLWLYPQQLSGNGMFIAAWTRRAG